MPLLPSGEELFEKHREAIEYAARNAMGFIMPWLAIYEPRLAEQGMEFVTNLLTDAVHEILIEENHHERKEFGRRTKFIGGGYLACTVRSWAYGAGFLVSYHLQVVNQFFGLEPAGLVEP